MDGERFVRGLAAALPEAFAGQDLEAGFFDDGVQPGHQWMVYTALEQARNWIEDNALTVKRRAQAVEVRRTAPLQRFFRFIELEAQSADEAMENLLMIELFEHTPWTENVLGYLGPRTIALLRKAQVELAPYSGWMGRWDDGRRRRGRRAAPD